MALFWFAKKIFLRDYAEFDVICYKQINKSKLSHFVGEGESTDCYFFFFNHCLLHCVYITCQVQNMSSPESRTLCACWQFSYIKPKYSSILLFFCFYVCESNSFFPKNIFFWKLHLLSLESNTPKCSPCFSWVFALLLSLFQIMIFSVTPKYPWF